MTRQLSKVCASLILGRDETRKYLRIIIQIKLGNRLTTLDAVWNVQDVRTYEFEAFLKMFSYLV